MSKQIEELLASSKIYREKQDAEGLKFADKAYQDALEINNIPLVVAALKERVRYAVRIQRDYGQVEKLCREILSLLDAGDEPLEAALAYNFLGICTEMRGEYMNARNNYLKVLELIEPVPNQSYDMAVVLGNGYFNLAKLYIHHETNDSNAYIAKALETFNSIDDISGLARVWNLKAVMLSESEPIELRLSMFEKAFEYFEKGATNDNGYSTCLANIGLCYCRLKQFDKGLEILHRALTLATEKNNKPSLGFAYFQIGEAYRLKGSNELAIEYLKQAEKVMIEANSKVYLEVVYKEWATNLAAIGKHAEAHEKMEKYNALVKEQNFGN